MAEEISELMMAAIAAVIAATQGDGDDPARQPGSAWSQDHRRQMTGKASLMNARAGRSPWR